MPSSTATPLGGRSVGNYLRTAVLMAALIALLAIGGRAIGGDQGMLIFGALGLALNFVMYWFSDRIALLAHRAQQVSRAEAPTPLRDRRAAGPARRHADAAHLPIPSAAANAFATGRNPEPRRGRRHRRHPADSCPSASWRRCWRTSCRTSGTATS